MTDRVKWGTGRKREFAAQMFHELQRAMSARSELDKRNRDYLAQYRALPADGVTNFPFEGAHALTFPVTAMNLDPIQARFMANVHATENLWTLKARSAQWMDFAKPLQDALTWIDQTFLNMWDVNYRVSREALLLGTGVYKVGWRFQQVNRIGYDSQGTRIRRTELINQPWVDHVSLPNFLLPPESRDVDPDAQLGAPWVAEKHRLRPPQLLERARGQEPFLPQFDPEGVTRVIDWLEDGPDEHRDKSDEQTRLSNAKSTFKSLRELELWEIHARFDTTGNGIEDDVIVIFHRPTQTILQATYNWLPARPYAVMRYLRGDGFYGIGIGEQTEMWQDIQSKVLNYDLDKLLLSNAPMFAAKEGANILPDEAVFPGKTWFLPDPSKDLVPFHMTAPGNFDMLGMMNFLQEGSKLRTGVTDLQFGSVGAIPGRTPATTISALLQEGNTRFDMSIKDMRMGALSEVGLRVLQNLEFQTNNFANNPFAQQYLAALPIIFGEEGTRARQALNDLRQPIEQGLNVQLTATSGQNNRELQKQSSLALLQVLGQLGPQFIELATLITQDPGGPVGQTAAKLFQGGSELLRRVVEQFDIPNDEDLVPNLEAILGAQNQLAQGQPISPLSQPGTSNFGAVPPQILGP